MQLRLLLATPDGDSLDLVRSLLGLALELLDLDVVAAAAHTRAEILEHVAAQSENVILLDWTMAEADTPALVREILHLDPLMRVIVLLPNRVHQYRRMVWNAGACNSIPKEHMEQEWLSSVLCVMHRAMEREARLAKMLP